MKRKILSALAFCVIPILWFFFNCAGLPKSSFKELYIDWKEYKDSGKPWGVFDGG